MDYMDPSMMDNENGIVEEAEYDNGYEGMSIKNLTLRLGYFAAKEKFL